MGRTDNAGETAPDLRPARPLGVWELSWPTMAAFSLQAVVGLVDLLFVAQLGTDAVAAVGVGGQAHFLTFAFITAVTTGTVALVARSSGAQNKDETAQVMQTSLGLAVLFGAFLSLAAPASAAFVALFGVSGPVVSLGGSYLQILLWASIPFAVGIAFSSALRGAGDVRTPLVIGVLMNVINIAGDWILIFGHLGAPVMGTDGSAIASVIAFSVGALLYYGLWRSDRLVISWGTGLRGFSVPITRRILKVGTPTAVEQLAFDVGLFVFLRMVSQFGTEAVSAYMIGVRILGFSFIPGLGFSMAASTLVGQYLGARQPEEAARAGWRAVGGAMGIMTALGLLIIMLATPISDWFGAAGSNTTRLTVVFIYILGACQPLMAIEFAVGGGLRGAGDTRFPLFSMMVGILGFRLGVGWWVTSVMEGGVVALWACLIGDYALRAGLLAARFWWGRWKTIRI